MVRGRATIGAMSKKTSLSYALERDTDVAYADLTDVIYLTRKAAYLGHRDFEILENSAGQDGGTLVTRKKVRVEVPGFAKKVLNEVNTVTETQEWKAKDASGVRRCDVEVQIAGVPAKITGGLTLAPEGGSTQVDVALEAKVSVPLLGGKIEGLVVGDLDKTMAGERAFGEQWAAEHP